MGEGVVDWTCVRKTSPYPVDKIGWLRHSPTTNAFEEGASGREEWNDLF